MSQANDLLSPGAFVSKVENARVLRAFGEEICLLLDGEMTGGKQTLWIETTPPGGGPPPHYHENEDESFYILEGRMSFLIEGEWREVSEGAAVFAPRNSIHAFKNIGKNPSRMVVTTQPSGFEVFFSRCAAEFAKPSGPDMQRVLEMSAEHGIRFVTEQ